MIDKITDVITIDGPAGSGKSTTARLVAQKLGFIYLDTGAMYRALTLKALKQEFDIQNESEIQLLINSTTIELQINQQRLKIMLDNEDVTSKIRTQKITQAVSLVSAYPAVRNLMVQQQRQIGKKGKLVAEGRDMGTVVFPDARLKIFLIASLTERAKRRFRDFCVQCEAQDLVTIQAELKQRDMTDSTRAIGPLRKADDAIELDTTNLTIEQQVDFIIQAWKQKGQNSNQDRN